MFVGEQCGKAKEAIEWYTSLFKNSQIKNIEYLSADEADGKENLVKIATFTLDGQEYIANDSPAPHQFTFTPAISIFVSCDSEEELESLFKALSTDGKVLMPADNYGFSKKFAWTNDRYGVSWQLNFA